jgi:4-oxalomesaconate tautomerase
VAFELAGLGVSEGSRTLDIEHPTGYFSVTLEVAVNDGVVAVLSAALLRTARLLMRGDVFVPASTWPPS